MTAAPPDPAIRTDAAFWEDWWRNWYLYGTVYAINHPEPRIIPAETLTVHEGPCPGTAEAQAPFVEALRALEVAASELNLAGGTHGDRMRPDRRRWFHASKAAYAAINKARRLLATLEATDE